MERRIMALFGELWVIFVMIFYFFNYIGNIYVIRLKCYFKTFESFHAC